VTDGQPLQGRTAPPAVPVTCANGRSVVGPEARSTRVAVTVARGVNSENFRILYDLYHSIAEGEDPATELANATGLVDYVQIADVPGRGEPGSGGLGWVAQLATLRASGYDGPIGLEYFPTVESVASVARIRAIAAEA
jgi:hydroxypyruvate isomerase